MLLVKVRTSEFYLLVSLCACSEVATILHHTHTSAHPPHTHMHTHHTHTDELIQAIRQDIAIASEKLEDPPMKELAVQLDNHLRTKHLD